MPRNLVAGPTHEEDIIIFDNDNFLNKLRKFVQYGSEHVEVISDFDMTFTRYKTNGVKGVSTYQLIQASVLSPERASYVKSLYERYHPIEIDPNVPLDLKEKHMQDWWEKSNDTLLQEGFLEANMVDYVFRSTHYFRYGLPEFLNKCREKLTPITILSGGLGNLIDASLQQITPCHNINVISNYIQFDVTGKSVCFRHPEVRANKSSFLVGRKVRRNVIVIGDLPSDVKMVEHVNYECCLKIGFLNDPKVYNMDNYREVFDVVILNDGDFTFINMLLSLIHKEKYELPTRSHLNPLFRELLLSI
ncbi:hypothetical protein SteCoe_4800 [Stentor coeruleus]|uniref:5'-nucleotidase n=1 Tax=Stentor coeruleus TaxID=5963 RepID=A0A1R2CU16_9CILI|nr:hypothetical protein SteCoe_4800 [Stentor coeruleus]